mgnify:CR=1 FL=1
MTSCPRFSKKKATQPHGLKIYPPYPGQGASPLRGAGQSPALPLPATYAFPVSLARISARLILPLMVLGSSFTYSTMRGYL